MRVLVCGSRIWTDYQAIGKVLDERRYLVGDFTVIHGAAAGADQMAGAWAVSHNLPVDVYPAEWGKYGKRAGYLRNVQMLEEGKPDMAIAFILGVSRGARMMVKLAREAHVRVIVHEQQS